MAIIIISDHNNIEQRNQDARACRKIHRPRVAAEVVCQRIDADASTKREGNSYRKLVLVCEALDIRLLLQILPRRVPAIQVAFVAQIHVARQMRRDCLLRSHARSTRLHQCLPAQLMRGQRTSTTMVLCVCFRKRCTIHHLSPVSSSMLYTTYDVAVVPVHTTMATTFCIKS